jgi:hypothetical protein
MSNWIYIKNDEEVVVAIPVDRDFEVLFDNGEILRYSEENFPFAKIIAWRELSEPV